MAKPAAFLITIDTEGDNLWSRPAAPTCRNALFLPRFQALCEQFGLKPTYVTNYEMARDAAFIDLARDGLARGTLEVGMHLHAWDTPPAHPLDGGAHGYLIDYPLDAMRAKVETMTRLLEDTFGRPMTSHRAGRWAMDERYAGLLVEFGYRVDCSVTPHLSWTDHSGAHIGRGGADYRDFPDHPYRLDPADIAGPSADGPLLEVPLTVMAVPGFRRWRPGRVRRAVGHVFPWVADPFPTVRDDPFGDPADPQWLRPTGRNRPNLLWILDEARRRRLSYVEFMLHSSEFMPGGSPTFDTEAKIESLYDDLTALFEAARGRFVGQTLTEFADAWTGR